MKSDLTNNRRTAKKVNYRESWDDSEEESEQSIQDLESKRVSKGNAGKGGKKKASSYDDDDDDDDEFDPKAESDSEIIKNEEAEEDESLSMQIDEISLENDGKAKKPKAKKEAKPKKKVAPKAANHNKDCEETNSKINDEVSLGSGAKKPKKARKKKEDGGADTNKVPKEKKEKKPKEKKEKKEKVPKSALDLTYDIEKNYFYQELTEEELSRIQEFFEAYFVQANSFDANKDAFEIKTFLDNYPNLRKGIHNVEKLKKIIEGIFTKIQNNLNIFNFEKYRLVSNLITSEYYTYKPTVLEAYFFPNKDNEVYVVNMIRTCKETLDIAIFTLTNDKISNAILEAYSRNVKVRIIADDECCKMWGSDVLRLAAADIPVKTDNQIRFHMHHKFAVLDRSLVITGSFNWTSQAVKFNQENIIFYENKDLAMKYSDAYDSLWNEFTTVITAQEAKEKIEEQLKQKQEKMDQKKLEKETNKANNDKEKSSLEISSKDV